MALTLTSSQSFEHRCVAPGCDTPVAANRRKYCDEHGQQASALRKREVRRARNRAWREACARGENPQPPYLEGWGSREAFNAYHRENMSRWRHRLSPGCERILSTIE